MALLGGWIPRTGHRDPLQGCNTQFLWRCALGEEEDAPTPLQYCLGFEKGALSKRVCCAVNVNTGLK